MKYVFSIILLSLVAVALEVGQEIEITQYLNARYKPNFAVPATSRTRLGVLASGTRAEITEIKKFRSGNSGLQVKVMDGQFKERIVWVYFNKKSPALKLADTSGTPTADPVVSGTGVTTRPLPATPDPVLSPDPVVSGAPQSIPPPPVALPGLIDRANEAVGAMTPVGDSGCRDCAASSVPIPSPAAAAPAPPAGDHLETSSEDGLYIQNADVKCSYRDLEFPRNPQIYPGTIDVKIENYVVTRLDAQIDGCRVQLGDYRQIHENTIKVNGVERVVQIQPRNIVLKNAAGCVVVLSSDQKTRGSNRPTMNFGWVVVGGSPCARQCPNNLRKFWQISMDPARQICH